MGGFGDQSPRFSKLGGLKAPSFDRQNVKASHALESRLTQTVIDFFIFVLDHIIRPILRLLIAGIIIYVYNNLTPCNREPHCNLRSVRDRNVGRVCWDNS